MYQRPIAIQIRRVMKAKIHATAHCQRTTPTAHLVPNSLLMTEIEATQGVYKRENTSIVAAETVERAVWILLPNKISMVDTTLSLAINPLISDVTIRQSPNPNGARTGAIKPAAIAIRLSEESATRFRCRSKLCRNQTTIVAIRMTLNALLKKSYAFSHKSCATFLIPGIR